MSATIYSLATRRPVRSVREVVIAEAPKVSFADLKATFHPCDWNALIRRALYAAQFAQSSVDRELARGTLWWIGNGPHCAFPDVRDYAKRCWSRTTPQPPKGAA